MTAHVLEAQQSLGPEFATLPSVDRVRRTIRALESNGIDVLRAANSAEAKRIVLDLIPDGAQVHHGASRSLDVTGIAQALESSGRYEPVRPLVRNMDRKTQAAEIRRLIVRPGRDARQRARRHRDWFVARRLQQR